MDAGHNHSEKERDAIFATSVTLYEGYRHALSGEGFTAPEWADLPDGHKVAWLVVGHECLELVTMAADMRAAQHFLKVAFGGGFR